MQRDAYSRANETRTVDGGHPSNPPRFRYEYIFNNRMRPTEVTIVDRDAEDLSTHWITADVDDAIPVEDCR